KAGDREIEAAPEEMDRARLAEKPRAESREHLVDLHQRLPEAGYLPGIIGGMDAVFLERDRVGDLDRRRPEVRIQVQRAQPADEFGVEIGHRAGAEGNAVAPAVADIDAQAMIDEVETDLEGARAARDRRRRQAARGHVQ